MAFYSLRNFTFLSLKNNSIKIIYDFLFLNFIQFDISENFISTIHKSSFKNVSTLYFDYSSLISLKDLSYCYFTSSFLYLGNQKIETINENTLKGLYLKIDLSFNLLTSNSFERRAFGFLPNLNDISFAENLIDALNFNDAFQFNLTNLKLLDFENNKISSIQKGFFSRFPSLIGLLLSYNNFGSLKKYYFCDLDNLKYLNLSNNQILTIEGKTFENLGSLVYLNLSDNLIYDLSQSLLKNLTKLEFFILSENKLELVEKQYFKGLNNLKYLDLTNNDIKLLYKDSFQSTINLESLYMKSNLINNLNGSLQILKYLSTLDLSFNKMERFQSTDFLSNITHLDLSFNPLRQFELNQSNLFGLKLLHLSGTNSSLISNVNFELFSQLEELDLSDNFNINTSQIKKLSNLKKLNLRNTNTSDCSFITNLKAIEELDVGNNKNYFSCLWYSSLPLKSLKISNISLRGILVNTIKNLIYLDASFNNLDTIEVINNFKNLIYLDLSFNIINNVIISSYVNFNFHILTKLEYINLNNSLTKSLTNFELKFGNKLEKAVLRIILCSSNYLRIILQFFLNFASKTSLNKK
jgi:Leucine-rich repeat (LRR) protein